MIESNGKNNLPIESGDENWYTFTNADNKFKSIKKSEKISYTYGDQIFLIKVKEVKTDGDTISIRNDETAELSDFFSVLKLESNSDINSLEYQKPENDDGMFTFTGFTDVTDEDFNINYDDIKLPQPSGLVDLPVWGKNSKEFSANFEFNSAGDPNYDPTKNKDKASVEVEAGLKGELGFAFKCDFDFFLYVTDNPIVNYMTKKYEYAKFDLDTTISINGSVEGKVEISSKEIGFIKQFLVPGVAWIDFTPRFIFSVTGTVGFEGTITRSMGFDYSGANGTLSTYRKDPDPQIVLNAEVEIEVGVDLGPDFESKVGPFDLAALEFSCKLGVKANAKKNFLDSNVILFKSETKHDCLVCFEIEFYGFCELSMDVFILGEMLKTTPTFEVDTPKAKAYLSLDQGKFGLGECSNLSYRAVIKVRQGSTVQTGLTVFKKASSGNYEEVGKTDQSGEYKEYLKPGTYVFKVNDITKTVVIKDKAINVTIDLEPDIKYGDITGFVKDSKTGNGIVGASVTVTSSKGDTKNTSTTSGGKFSIGDLIPGSYTIKVSHSNYENGVASATVSANTSSILQDILLIPKTIAEYGAITGFVKDSKTGKGIVGASVQCTTSDGASTSMFTTDGGKFEFNDLTVGTCTIKVTHNDYETSTTSASITANTTSVLQDDILLPPKTVVEPEPSTPTTPSHTDETSALSQSGDCGDDVHWALYANGTLYVYGTGEMTSHPWDEYKDSILSVVIEDGVTSVCSAAFSKCINLEKVTFPETLESINSQYSPYINRTEYSGAFEGCELLPVLI